MSTARKTALVAGANGIIGRNLVAHLRGTGEWDGQEDRKEPKGLCLSEAPASPTSSPDRSLQGVFHDSLGLPEEAERPNAADRRTDDKRHQDDHRELGMPMKHVPPPSNRRYSPETRVLVQPKKRLRQRHPPARGFPETLEQSPSAEGHKNLP